MITCPACGKENEDPAFECRRCRAPLRDEMPEPPPAPAHVTGSASLGGVCQRCETWNEPGVQQCANCGQLLVSFEQPAAGSAVEEAAPDPWALPDINDPGAAVSVSAAGAPVASGVPQVRPAPEPAATSAEKACPNCGAQCPPAAKFCSECGTPFTRRAPPPAQPSFGKVKTATIQVAPSIQIDADLAGAPADEPLPEELPAEAPPPEEPLPEELPQEQAFAEALPEEQVPEPQFEEPAPQEQPPPFQASLVMERGPAPGTSFALEHLENTVGASGTHVELREDPFVAPHAATLLFADDHLVLRDEGSVNGVFVKIHDAAALEPGDLFIAGERLFRYEGLAELPRDVEGDTPFLGAPRPQGAPVRVVEVLSGGRTGRTCHRAGPIAIGRTGCDMNFPADSLLGPRHAEVRITDDGTAMVTDLGAAPAGVFVRLRAQAEKDLQPGDVLILGEQQLRLEVA